MLGTFGAEGLLEELDGLWMTLLGDQQVGPFPEDGGEPWSWAGGAEELRCLAVGCLRGLVIGLALGAGERQECALFRVGVLAGAGELEGLGHLLADGGVVAKGEGDLGFGLRHVGQ